MPKYTGIVKFGSGDASIIAEASLKTLVSLTDLGAGSVLSTGASIDPVFGAIGGTNGAVKMVLDNLPANIHVQGQLSFKVTTTSITAISANTASVGTVRTGASYHLSFSEADSSPYGRMWQNANNELNLQMNTTTDSTVVHQTNQGGVASRGVHSLGKDPTTIVTLSWDFGSWELLIDDVIYGVGVRGAVPVSTIFEAIFLGSNRGSGSGNIPEAYYSDFVIADAPVRAAAHPQLRKIIMFGDSLVRFADPEFLNGMWGHNTSLVVESGLIALGFDCEVRDWVDGTAGATVTDTGTPALEATRAAMLLNNPSLVIFACGINDTTNWDFFSGDFDTDLKDHMTTILANSEDVKIALCTVASLQGASAVYPAVTFAPNTVEANAFIEAIPAWWDTNNPSDKGRIVICDTFAALGGETIQADMFKGQVDGDNLDLHYSARGYRLWGEEIVKAIVRLLT